MTKETNFDPSLLDEIIDQSHNPPGRDPVLGAFYEATLQTIDRGEPFSDLIHGVKINRQEITDKHLVNLLFRTYQFVRLSQGDLAYRYIRDVAWWHTELSKIAGQDDGWKTFEQVLLERSTTTTIYQRYAGPYALITHLFDGQPVTVTDLGCGGNYGLRGIELGEPFKPIDDQTPQMRVNKLLSKPINLLSGLSVDKEEPDSEDARRWRFACSFYPNELDGIEDLQKFEAKIRGSQRVRFIQGDLLSATFDLKQKSDVLILSTILYQLGRQDQTRLMERARDWLKPQGILIVQDFAEKDPKDPAHLDFSESWFGREFSYRTFVASTITQWAFNEALQWNNGRCNLARAGQDFEYIFYELSSARAALAQSTS